MHCFAGAQQLLQLDSVVCLFVCCSYLSRFFFNQGCSLSLTSIMWLCWSPTTAPIRQSLSLFIGSLQNDPLYFCTRVTRKHSTVMCYFAGTQQLLQLDSVVKQKAFPPPAANARQWGRNKQEVMVARWSLSVGEIINPWFKIPGLSGKNQSLEKQRAISSTPFAAYFDILLAAGSETHLVLFWKTCRDGYHCLPYVCWSFVWQMSSLADICISITCEGRGPKIGIVNSFSVIGLHFEDMCSRKTGILKIARLLTGKWNVDNEDNCAGLWSTKCKNISCSEDPIPLLRVGRHQQNYHFLCIRL